jgi:Ca2+-binding RTX toxin-like protein
VALVAGALIALGVPATSGAQEPTRDSVVGSLSGTTTDGSFIRTFDVAIDVSSGPGGESPTGSLSARNGTFSIHPPNAGGEAIFSLTPTCLSVNGNTAIIGFTGRVRTEILATDNPVAGLTKVVDNGGGGADTFEWAYSEGSSGDPDLPGPTTCAAFPGPFPQVPLHAPPTTGHIGVVDAPAGCEGREPTVAGTTGNDTLVGTPGDDVIVGLDGDDVILGLGGKDLVCAGPGNDQVYAGTGDDRVFGGDGNDLLRGGAGNDALFGEAGNDQLRGMDGNDVLVGGDGDDAMFGGDGNDFMLGQADTDALFGGPGDDALAGHDGDDVLVGGLGTNACDGGAGTNTLIGC